MKAVAMVPGLAAGLSLMNGISSVNAGPLGLSEIRGGVFAHSVYDGFLPVDPNRYLTFNRIEDVNVELLFDLPGPVSMLQWIGAPRVSLGGTFNLNGRESIAHLGATWTVPVLGSPLFVEATLGGAVNNGQLTGAAAPMRNLGCHVGFYESASVGWNLSANANVMLTYEHTSNLDLCPANEGLSNVGVRFGFKF